MTASRLHDRYDRALAREIVKAAADRVSGFSGLIERTKGAWPPDVRLAVLKSLAGGAIDRSTASRLLDEISARTDLENTMARPWLPTAHPLDSDWRFAPSTGGMLARRAIAAAAGGRVVLLGVPTVFAELAHHTAADVALLEGNSAMVSRLASLGSGHVIKCDLLRDPVPIGEADCIVADPPWYPEECAVFLWSAATIARHGGKVLASVPPMLVRPGIGDERRRLLKYGERCGLRLDSVETDCLSYETPQFEANALAASGLEALYPQWRRGDLLTFTRVPAQLPPRPHIRRRESWRFEGRQDRIAFRSVWPSRIDPRLSRLVPSDILPSVSRRDPLRPQIMVWTSGNRVFGCRDPLLAAAITQALIEGGDPTDGAARHVGHSLSADQRRWALAASVQIRELLAVEQLGLSALVRAQAG